VTDSKKLLLHTAYNTNIKKRGQYREYLNFSILLFLPFYEGCKQITVLLSLKWNPMAILTNDKCPLLMFTNQFVMKRYVIKVKVFAVH